MFSALPHQWRNSSAKLRRKNQEPKTLFKLLTFFCFCAAPRSGLPGLASRKRVQSYALIPNPPNFLARKYAIKHIFNIRLQIVHRTKSPPQAPNTLISRNINHKTRQPRQNAAPAAKKHRTPIIPSEKKSATPKKNPPPRKKLRPPRHSPPNPLTFRNKSPAPTNPPPQTPDKKIRTPLLYN